MMLEWAWEILQTGLSASGIGNIPTPSSPTAKLTSILLAGLKISGHHSSLRMTRTYLLAGCQNQLVPDPVGMAEAETIGIMSATTRLSGMVERKVKRVKHQL
jgi:hypothetical protein